MSIFGNVGQMQAEGFAETSEFDFAVVFDTELECLVDDLLGTVARTLGTSEE